MFSVVKTVIYRSWNIPVSYTHLDVYKRQEIKPRQEEYALRGSQARRGESYTKNLTQPNFTSFPKPELKCQGQIADKMTQLWIVNNRLFLEKMWIQKTHTHTHTHTPVSYTHLDVYKRQQLRRTVRGTGNAGLHVTSRVAFDYISVSND